MHAFVSLRTTTFAGLLIIALSACAGTPRYDISAGATPGQDRQPANTSPQRSPISLEELALLQQTLLFGEDDVAALRASLEILRPQVEDVLDVWYGFVGATPQLLQYFVDTETGAPDADYLAAVRVRFVRWILDTAAARHDQEWLDHQYEIALRHHSTKKNRTDGVSSAPIIHFRYLVALAYPITATLKPFLEKGDHSPEQVERMHQAWTKSVLLQCILWSHPYVHPGEF